LLVGNFGNGAINAFSPADGSLLGGLSDESGTPIRIDGLWALAFGNGGQGGDPNVLYFTAGPLGETHGLFGSLSPVDYLRISTAKLTPAGLVLTLVGGTPPFAIQEQNDLSGTNWTTVLTTSNLTAVLPQTNSAGFFRVKDHGAQ
jgi:hypothetical protein